MKLHQVTQFWNLWALFKSFSSSWSTLFEKTAVLNPSVQMTRSKDDLTNWPARYFCDTAFPRRDRIRLWKWVRLEITHNNVCGAGAVGAGARRLEQLSQSFRTFWSPLGWKLRNRRSLGTFPGEHLRETLFQPLCLAGWADGLARNRALAEGSWGTDSARCSPLTESGATTPSKPYCFS